MSKEIKDIAMWEETDSELAKYSIQELTSLVIKFKEQNKQLVNVISNQDKRIDKAIEYIKNNATSNYFDKTTNMFRREVDLLNILRGEDIKEIPQFEGTLEQLDKLSIRGETNEDE